MDFKLWLENWKANLALSTALLGGCSGENCPPKATTSEKPSSPSTEWKDIGQGFKLADVTQDGHRTILIGKEMTQAQNKEKQAWVSQSHNRMFKSQAETMVLKHLNNIPQNTSGSWKFRTPPHMFLKTDVVVKDGWRYYYATLANEDEKVD